MNYLRLYRLKPYNNDIKKKRHELFALFMTLNRINF